jgi:hypothetical protein
MTSHLPHNRAARRARACSNEMIDPLVAGGRGAAGAATAADAATAGAVDL